MTKQRKKNVKSASMVDLRSVHTVDTAPDNPWAHNMLEDDEIVGNITTLPCQSAWLQIETNVTETLVEDSERKVGDIQFPLRPYDQFCHTACPIHCHGHNFNEYILTPQNDSFEAIIWFCGS